MLALEGNVDVYHKVTATSALALCHIMPIMAYESFVPKPFHCDDPLETSRTYISRPPDLTPTSSHQYPVEDWYQATRICIDVTHKKMGTRKQMSEK